MANPQALSSIATLVGALRVNYALPAPASMEDLGGKVAALISQVNMLNSSVSFIFSSIAAAIAASQVSGLSTGNITSLTSQTSGAKLANFNVS